MIYSSKTVTYLLVFVCAASIISATRAGAESLVIATSRSVKAPLEEIGRAFEAQYPDVRIRLHVEPALDLRRTIGSMENTLMVDVHPGRGLIHLIAPGGDELIARLDSKNYIRPGSQRAYAVEPLVLVVPESVVEAPTSFEALAQDGRLRIVIADPSVTTLGQKSRALLMSLGLWETLNGRLDVAVDVRSVIDHLMRGRADVGILFGPEAVRERQRVRIAAVADHRLVEPLVHSLAMEYECPDRTLAQRFIDFTQEAAAQAILRSLGYRSPVEGLTRKATAARSTGG